MSRGTQNFAVLAGLVALAVALGMSTMLAGLGRTPAQEALSQRLRKIATIRPLEADQVISHHPYLRPVETSTLATFVYARASMNCETPDRMDPEAQGPLKLEFRCGRARLDPGRGLVSTGLAAEGCAKMLEAWTDEPPHFEGCTKRPSIIEIAATYACARWCAQPWFDEEDEDRAACLEACGEAAPNEDDD